MYLNLNVLKHTFHTAMQDQSNKWLFVRGRLFPPSLPSGAKFSNVLLCIVGLFAFTFGISIALVAQTVKSLSTVWETQVDPWIRKISWRRKWQPTPVFLPGKPHGWRSLVGYSPWGHKESVSTEQLQFTSQISIQTLLSANAFIFDLLWKLKIFFNSAYITCLY